jgi:hypothetical protein
VPGNPSFGQFTARAGTSIVQLNVSPGRHQ